MNILITGVSGFIGFHLSQKLSKKNSFKIYGLDNHSSISKKTQRLRKEIIKKNKKVNFKKINLLNFDKLLKSYNNINFDIVIHLAAQPGVRISQIQPNKTIDNNIKTFINILEFCRKKKIKNFFYASSSSVYGNTTNFNEHKNLKETTSIYGASKLCNEILASTYNYLYNINIFGLRFFTVYGPLGREDMVYYKFLNQIKKDKKITIYGDMKSVRSFTYIDDVTNAIYKLITKFIKRKNFNEIINIGNVNNDSLEDLVKIIKKYYNDKFKIVYLSRNKSDMFRTAASTKKIKRYINFKPNISLEDGMKRFIDWFKLTNNH